MEAKFPDDPVNIEGKPRQRKPQLTGADRTRRVDFCIRLMLMQYRRDQVKKLFSEEFKIKPRCAERYITIARKKMRLVMDKTTEEVIQESIGHYSQILQQAVSRIEWLDKAIQLQHNLVLKATQHISNEKRPTVLLSPEEKREMSLQYEQRTVAMALLREYSSERAAMSAERFRSQSEIDKLLSSPPPLRVAMTDTKGNDIKSAATAEEADRRLAGLAAVVRQRLEHPHLD